MRTAIIVCLGGMLAPAFGEPRKVLRRPTERRQNNDYGSNLFLSPPATASYSVDPIRLSTLPTETNSETISRLLTQTSNRAVGTISATPVLSTNETAVDPSQGYGTQGSGSFSISGRLISESSVIVIDQTSSGHPSIGYSLSTHGPFPFPSALRDSSARSRTFPTDPSARSRPFPTDPSARSRPFPTDPSAGSRPFPIDSSRRGYFPTHSFPPFPLDPSYQSRGSVSFPTSVTPRSGKFSGLTKDPSTGTINPTGGRYPGSTAPLTQSTGIVVAPSDPSRGFFYPGSATAIRSASVSAVSISDRSRSTGKTVGIHSINRSGDPTAFETVTEFTYTPTVRSIPSEYYFHHRRPKHHKHREDKDKFLEHAEILEEELQNHH